MNFINTIILLAFMAESGASSCLSLCKHIDYNVEYLIDDVQNKFNSITDRLNLIYKKLEFLQTEGFYKSPPPLPPYFPSPPIFPPINPPPIPFPLNPPLPPTMPYKRDYVPDTLYFTDYVIDTIIKSINEYLIFYIIFALIVLCPIFDKYLHNKSNKSNDGSILI